MELIDKAELMKYPIRIDHYDKKHGNKHFVFGIESVLEFAEQLPTIDAVEVVRCCDCKYGVAHYKDSDDNVPHLYCHSPNLDEDALSPKVDFTDFCSYGRRIGELKMCEVSAGEIVGELRESCTGNEFTPPTNADRIRAMSDEELATWILENINCDKENIMCCPELYKSSGKCNGRCLAGRLDWLKQEQPHDRQSPSLCN